MHILSVSCSSVTEEPVILSGTLRSTIDPLGEHNDPEIVGVFEYD